MYIYGTYVQMILLRVREVQAVSISLALSTDKQGRILSQKLDTSRCKHGIHSLFVPYLKPLTPNMHNCMGKWLAWSRDFEFMCCKKTCICTSSRSILGDNSMTVLGKTSCNLLFPCDLTMLNTVTTSL